MSVLSYQLIRDDGVPIPAIKALAATRVTQVDAALRVMVAEARTPFAHHLRLRMADGSTVTARPKAAGIPSYSRAD